MENQNNLFTVQDLYDEQTQQTPVNVTKTYDPLHFWDDFGDRYFKSFSKMTDIQHHIAWIVHRMKSLDIKTVLDVGCSWCRLEPFLLDSGAAEEITAIDISQKQLDSAVEYLKDFPKLDKIKIIKASVRNMPFEREAFDCVLSCECLMHIPPSKVRFAMLKMRDVAKKYVMMVERYVYPGEHPQPHMWSHNYHKLAGETGLIPIESKIIANGIIAMVFKR